MRALDVRLLRMTTPRKAGGTRTLRDEPDTSLTLPERSLVTTTPPHAARRRRHGIEQTREAAPAVRSGGVCPTRPTTQTLQTHPGAGRASAHETRRRSCIPRPAPAPSSRTRAGTRRRSPAHEDPDASPHPPETTLLCTGALALEETPRRHRRATRAGAAERSARDYRLTMPSALPHAPARGRHRRGGTHASPDTRATACSASAWRRHPQRGCAPPHAHPRSAPLPPR